VVEPSWPASFLFDNTPSFGRRLELLSFDMVEVMSWVDGSKSAAVILLLRKIIFVVGSVQ